MLSKQSGKITTILSFIQMNIPPTDYDIINQIEQDNLDENKLALLLIPQRFTQRSRQNGHV